jgi:hypothetical protein
MARQESEIAGTVFPPLEVPCEQCGGTGRDPGEYPCDNCDGIGYHLTDFGQSVFDFIDHSIRRLRRQKEVRQAMMGR